jgi:hypothetical protein
MLRILRAFAWLRWRILLNALERPAGRDALQRFSLAVEQLGPLLVGLLMVPSALSITATASFAGWRLAQGAPTTIPLEAIRFVLLAATVAAIAMPVLLPGGGRTNPVRLLLLPIPRPLLFLSQTLSSLADPWMLLAGAAVVPLPLGIAAGGAFAAAATVALAGLLVLAVLTGLTALATTALQLVARDRKRGEILALILILILPLAGALPALLGTGARSENETARRSTELTRWWSSAARTAGAIVPSEAYIRTARASARADSVEAAFPILALGTLAGIANGASYLLFARLLSSPAASGVRRRGGTAQSTAWRIPGVKPDTTAVAINQVRLALRTPRGRSSVLSPVVVFVVFVIMQARGVPGSGFLGTASGAGLAALACGVCLLSIVPLAMNQFAIDGAGLTLMFLSPLRTETLLAGKAIGNAIVAAMPGGVCFAGALLLAPGGDGWLWTCVPLALVSTYLLAAPAAAVVSASFPRAVDLNSIGQGSNAHAAAGLLGLLAFAGAGAPAVLIVLVANGFLDRPALAAASLLAWAGGAAAIGAFLMKAAARIVDKRRENLALIV